VRPSLVLCLGNEVLSDDSFGYWVARELERSCGADKNVDVIFSPQAGFNLIGLLEDRERVLIVDTITTGQAKPGTLHFIDMGFFTPSKNLTCSHQINLPTAVLLGGELGAKMPSHIDVLAVEAKDIETFGEALTPPLASALGAAVERVISWINFEPEKASQVHQMH
jgi:hydrogenase maturation protease